jgi:hypothetical protein
MTLGSSTLKNRKTSSENEKKYSLQSLATVTQIRQQRTLTKAKTINNQRKSMRMNPYFRH